MHTLLIILACFTGTFGFAFSTAGFLGMMDFKPRAGKSVVLFLLDNIVTGGIGSMLRDIAANWRDRAPERHLFYIGLLSSITCLALIFWASKVS